MFKCVWFLPTVKLLQKSRSSGSTESAEKILQSLSGQISEKMKNYTASRPTWEEKNAQIASRLQNSILTQNLSVKSAQNFMEKFVHKQGTKNGPSPSTLIEPSSYYASPISSDTPEQQDSDNTAVTTSGNTESIDVQSMSSTSAKQPIKTKLAGKVLASPISSGSNAAATAKIPRGVVTATPVTTQNTAAASQQQQQTPAQQGAINPTAISLANALKALAAAQSRAQQQQKKSNSTSTTAAAPDKPTSGVNKEPLSIPASVAATATTTTTAVSSLDKIVTANVNGPRNVPEVLKSEVKKSEEATTTITTQAPAPLQNTVTTPTHSTGSSGKSAHELADSSMREPSGGSQVSLNAILGTNLSPEAERLLSALITSLQPTQVSSSSGQTTSVPATAQSLPTTSAISSSALSFFNTVSSEQHPQGAPQYAPFPSSGTRVATEQLVGNTDDHFINHDDDTSQLLQSSSLVDGPLSASTDLGELCDLGTFPSSSDNKRPLELSDSLFTGSAIKRPHMDTNF